MAQTPFTEAGPSSSYSDPIYDRLDTFAQGIKRRWWIYVLVLVVVIVVAQVVRHWAVERPDAASSTAFNLALEKSDQDSRAIAMKELAEDAATADYWRARAYIEVAQNRFSKDDGPGAKEAAQKAVQLADKTPDQELKYAARLTLAGAEYQLNDLEAAAKDYAAVESAGGRFLSQQLEATLGAARTLTKSGKPDEAMAKLEPLIGRSDAGATELLNVARTMYWTLKRQQAEAAAQKNAPPASIAAPPAAQTGAEPQAPIAVPSAAAPATAAAPAPVPAPAPTVAPATPQPAPAAK